MTWIPCSYNAEPGPSTWAACKPFMILPGALPSPTGNVGLRFGGVFNSVGKGEGDSPFGFCRAMMTEVLRFVETQIGDWNGMGPRMYPTAGVGPIKGWFEEAKE